MIEAHEQTPITASLVPNDGRLDFLPFYFSPRLMMRAEAFLYDWMRLLSKDYTGGYWHYYTLSNGGFYLAPAYDGQMHVEVAGNWFEGELSADAAGIVATLFAVSQIATEAQAKGLQVDALIDRYHFLRDFAAEHAEGPAIFRAID